MAERTLRGARLGGQSFEDERGIEFAARQQVGYLCSRGHSFEITMSVEADVPALWECPRCGAEGRATSGIEPEVKDVKPARTHWDMLLERRSIKELEDGLVFVNLVETDMNFGHRRDPEGFHRCLKEFDRRVPEIEAALRPGDLLVVTADHGCDPTYRGSDHTRELVPLVAHIVGEEPVAATHRGYFSDVGASVCAWRVTLGRFV